MKRILCCFLSLFLALVFVFSSFDLSDAKGWRGGSFSRAFSSPKISSSIKTSNPSFSAPKSSTTSRSSSKSGFFGSSVTKESKINKSRDSYLTKSDPNLFKKQPPKVDTKVKDSSKVSSVKTKYIPKTDNNFYRSPPPYVYNTYPSFGSFDTLFLMYMLSSNPAWFYHHQDDKDVQKFKTEITELSKDNDDLKKQIQNMELKVKELEGENVKKDPNYVPEDIEKTEIKENNDEEDSFGLILACVAVIIGLGGIIYYHKL